MKLVVLDDHPMVRKGIEMIFELEDDIEIVGYASNLKEALSLIETKKPDIVLVDLRLTAESGLDLIREARKKSPLETKYVILSSFATEEEIEKAMDLDVDGYILKEALPEELIYAVRIISRGRRYFDPAVIQFSKRKEYNTDTHSIDSLTKRECEVLYCLSKGMSNKEIAAKLFISEHTVKKHVSQILEKLDLHDRVQAALYAISKDIKADIIM